MDEEEIKIKMDDGVHTLLASEGIYVHLLTCGRRSLVCGIQNDIVVSLITP